jgi:DNA polymerase III subunit beta
MELYIDRTELSRALASIQGVIERRSTTPEYSHALLHARPEGLRITATDSEVAFIGELAANVEQPGELAVEAANLFQVVRTLPDPTVHLKLGPSNRLEVRCGRSFFRLPGIPADEYPPLPAFDALGTARVRGADLRRLVEQTGFAVATDDARYGLNGAHVEASGEGRVRMVATDGHRLSAAEAAFEGELAISPRMLVPRKAMNVLKKLLDGPDEAIEVSFGDGAVRTVRPGQTLWFRLLDGEFPDYKAVLPQDCKHRVTADVGALSAALKRVNILVQERTRAVRFAFEAEQCTIQVHNVDRGEVTEVVPVELEGEPITVGFNVRYLQDILGAVPTDQVRLELSHALGPCLVQGEGDEDAFFVVMPMRLD